MDRPIVYPGQIPLETHVLQTAQFAMIADGIVAAAVLGNGTTADGMACVPTAPASMSVIVAPGALFSYQPVEGLSYSSLGTDAARSILKVGANLDSTTFSVTAPTTPGYSQNFLVTAQFSESDTGSTVEPFYNPSNPAQPYSGPANSGIPSMTLRTQRVALSLIPGAAAAAGTQATPAAPPGTVGLWVITVPAGAVAITGGNIAVATGAPFVGPKLTQRAPTDSAALTGTPTAPTPAAGDASARLATTAFVAAAISSILGSAGYATVAYVNSQDAAQTAAIEGWVAAVLGGYATTGYAAAVANNAQNAAYAAVLSRFTASISGEYGYFVIPGTSVTLYVQWGFFDYGGVGTGLGSSITQASGFTVNFPNACLHVQATGSDGTGWTEGSEMSIGVVTKSYSQATYRISRVAGSNDSGSETGRLYWFAIGF